MSESTSNVSTSTPVSESVPSTDAQSSSTPTQEATKTEGQPTPEEVVEEMFKLRVSGEDREYPRSEMIRLAQLGLGANKKFEEAAKTRKEIEAFAKNIMENPREFLRNHPNREAILQASGELISEYLDEQEKLNQMSDSERRAVELQRQLELRQKELDERDNQIKTQLKAHYQKQFYDSIVNALGKTELPIEEESIIKVASLFKKANSQGIQTSFDECAKIVERKELGYLNKISELRNKNQKQKEKSTPKTVSTPKEKKRMSMEEWRKRLDQLS